MCLECVINELCMREGCVFYVRLVRNRQVNFSERGLFWQFMIRVR